MWILSWAFHLLSIPILPSSPFNPCICLSWVLIRYIYIYICFFSFCSYLSVSSPLCISIYVWKPDTANIIAIGAAADLASRIFLAILAVFIQMPSRYIYLAGAFFTVLSRFGKRFGQRLLSKRNWTHFHRFFFCFSVFFVVFLRVFDFQGMAIITAVMGFLRTWIHVPLPLVFGEYLPKERWERGGRSGLQFNSIKNINYWNVSSDLPPVMVYSCSCKGTLCLPSVLW